MPNWCSTRMTIFNENETILEKLSELIDEWTSKDYMPNEFGNNWLGNIVLGSGIGTVDSKTDADLNCRGWLTYKELGDNYMYIDTETAWSPMLKMWVKLLEKYAPDSDIIYESVEQGNDIYSTNDVDLIEHYIIDCYDIDNVDMNWEATEEDVREALQKLLNTTETDVDKLIEMLDDFECGDDGGIWIHKWSHDEVDAWD